MVERKLSTTPRGPAAPRVTGWEKEFMQQVWLALIGGLILGWLIEWIIDWQFWRRNVAELRAENQALRRQLEAAQAELAALQPPPAQRPPSKLAVTQPVAAPASKPIQSAQSAPPADPSNKRK